ncbi:hypothetical protein RHMOL_Rhmol05G0150300 [Rhododendron molle]|uniref:Uncharacterized protein n=1 Tax=Rhododendron molle TaxID=49168 RepID=A0ACC0NQQ5_RHOML|nr:hypothetical protein RHMOL_Rhmol05G0150300 [Rhododendron molle]
MSRHLNLEAMVDHSGSYTPSASLSSTPSTCVPSSSRAQAPGLLMDAQRKRTRQDGFGDAVDEDELSLRKL